MRKLYVFFFFLLFSTLTYSQNTRKENTDEVGRFIVKNVEYESNGASDDVGSVKTVNKMLIRIDTLTGKTWKYSSFGLVQKKKLVLSQQAWVPLDEEAEDIAAKLRRINGVPQNQPDQMKTYKPLSDDSIKRIFEKNCSRMPDEREIGYFVGASIFEPLSEKDLETILHTYTGCNINKQ